MQDDSSHVPANLAGTAIALSRDHLYLVPRRSFGLKRAKNSLIKKSPGHILYGSRLWDQNLWPLKLTLLS
jgi:hypothetical protein